MPLVLAFDAYGTLLDIHAAIGRHRARVGPEASGLSELWRQKQLEYSWTLSLAGRYLDFWSLTERALDYALSRFRSVDPAIKPMLLDAYKSLEAYPDAGPTLRELKARGRRTALLSNGSPAMLAAAVEAAGLGGDLDAVLSVDPLRLYKPRPEVYRLLTDSFKVPPSDVLFVSANRWDVMGAVAYGLQTVWVNRTSMPEEYRELAPSWVVPSLTAVLRLADGDDVGPTRPGKD